MNIFRRLFARQLVAAAPAPEPVRKGLRIKLQTVAEAMPRTDAAKAFTHRPYEPPSGVIPAQVDAEVASLRKMAMDFDYSSINGITGFGVATNGTAAFRGYQYLSLLMQQPEYRKMTATIAQEATRKWVRLTSKGKDDKGDKLAQLSDAMDTFQVRALFRLMAEYDGFFGRGQLFIDVKKPGGGITLSTDPELMTPLLRDKAKIAVGALNGFRAIEPLWTYPGVYDSANPMSPDFYRPQWWYVMGSQVHSTRLLTFVSRGVPDLLKASYNFGGLSLSQIAEPYVNNWLRTRDSVGDLLHSFSLTQLSTDLESMLSEGGAGDALWQRMALFNQVRDNRGVMLTNKDTEGIGQFNTPLSSLDKLQAQAQEQMSAVSSIPLVKLLGITPSGLNASSDGEVRVFYDYIHSYQEDLFRDPLQYVLNILQLNAFGAIDPDIGFEFEPLWQSDGLDQATIQKTQADTDAVLVGMGAIDPSEVRQRLIDDPDNGYHSLEAIDVIPPSPEDMDPQPPQDDPNADPSGNPQANDPKADPA